MGARTEEAYMQEVEKYRQYANDCIRLAGKAAPKDKPVLKIAEAREQQANIAEAAKTKKTDGKAEVETATP
jgi:hypothetical protein